MGVRKICNSGGVINVVGIELSEYNESAKTSGFVLVGLAVIGLIAGVSLIGKKI